MWFFNSLLNVKYSNPFNAADFRSEYFSGKAILPVKNLYLLTFPDDKSKILAAYLDFAL